MLQYLTNTEKTRFSELQGKLAQLLISEVEQQELSALVNKAQRAAQDRGAAVDAVKKLIADNQIDVSSIFSLEVIQRAAREPGSTKGRRPSKVDKSKPVKAYNKSEHVLIQVKLDKGAGAPSRYKKGQKLGKFVSKNFKSLDKDGQLVANLMNYATPLGKTYFATTEGKVELETFAKYIQSTSVAG